MNSLFVYGTLQSAELLKAVSGCADFQPVPAELAGYSVGSVAGDVVPFIRKSPGASCKGQLISDIPPSAWQRLCAYEGAFGYSLIDVEVSVGSTSQPAKIFLPPDDIPDAGCDWSLDEWTRNWQAMAVLAATELFRHDPPLPPQDIRAQWKTIEGRAWSKILAQQSAAPSTLRRSSKITDTTHGFARPPSGQFFRFEQAEVTSRRFDGSVAAPVTRECFVGFDGAFVLPYDPDRDRVLLIEQVRMGAIMRHDPNPWLLEPIAGLIDPRETPEDTIRREALEEAHLTDIKLHPIARSYPSPGGSTEFFHMFLGICSLPDDHPEFGGLADEGEDIRLHIISRGQAMDMLKTGEINVGPLLTMLLWLELNHGSFAPTG